MKRRQYLIVAIDKNSDHLWIDTMGGKKRTQHSRETNMASVRNSRDAFFNIEHF